MMIPSEIRSLRGSLTRAAFAAQLGVNAHTVYRWELPEASAHARRPRGAMLARLDHLARAATPDPTTAALQRVLEGQWHDAENTFLRMQREADPERRAHASTGLALIDVLYRADARRALAALGPALAPSAPVSALTEATAALIYSYPDGELFDRGLVHAHARRAEELARPGDLALIRAFAAMAEAN
ncbi:MAG: hypothetical protein NT062_00325, partial [Proteobacteria bacterium]|nr:hypothetical protein [Pseudomonadota bacterium]